MIDVLAQRLVDERSLNAEKLADVLKKAQEEAESLDNALVRKGLLNEAEMLEFFADYLGLEYHKSLEQAKVPKSFVERVPVIFARNYNLVAISEEDGLMKVACCRPLDMHPMDELASMVKTPVEPVLAPRVEISNLLNKAYAAKKDIIDETEGELEESGMLETDIEIDGSTDLLNVATAAPIIKLVNTFIAQALRRRASDIHIQPLEHKISVRYRVDGVLFEAMTPNKKLLEAIVARIKVMGKMDIAERRLPQDGRASVRNGDNEVDLRISSVPTSFGERVVIRLLDKSAKTIHLTDVGFSGRNLELFRHFIHYANGIILLTGPTGSGKTTTLHAAVTEINAPDVNIMTIEDPIEYQIAGVSQIEVNEKKGLTFARGLRSLVRQDPDIIMVGEIRDLETATIAIQSALTGHLVFSTLHTNDAPSTVTRLVDLGVEPFLVSSSVICVVAQRLLRTICKECKEEYTPTAEELRGFELEMSDLPHGHLWRGRGCEACFNSGYMGRMAIHEVMPVNEKIKEQIMAGVASGDIKRSQVQDFGLVTLRHDGVQKALQGHTTLEEVSSLTQR
ncbi:MAG: Flp pilus assembly complex ATPase component TadA, partial [Planctomycetaceae bacterium]|nr:Flp pilus assembly complex ATPase component TadA [Planctomycetaceae bacterium]